ncbi:MAG: hypothetical protein AB1489_01995 [Acidobacteriota bacterium]
MDTKLINGEKGAGMLITSRLLSSLVCLLLLCLSATGTVLKRGAPEQDLFELIKEFQAQFTGGRKAFLRSEAKTRLASCSTGKQWQVEDKQYNTDLLKVKLLGSEQSWNVLATFSECQRESCLQRIEFCRQFSYQQLDDLWPQIMVATQAHFGVPTAIDPRGMGAHWLLAKGKLVLSRTTGAQYPGLQNPSLCFTLIPERE